jgi:hypothetical protein
VDDDDDGDSVDKPTSQQQDAERGDTHLWLIDKRAWALARATPTRSTVTNHDVKARLFETSLVPTGDALVLDFARNKIRVVQNSAKFVRPQQVSALHGPPAIDKSRRGQ